MTDKATTDGEPGGATDEDCADETDSVGRLSRRGFTRAVGVSAGGLSFGSRAMGTATASMTEKICESRESFAVGDGVFSVVNNQWSTTAVEQCIQRDDDGSYGWEWDRGSTDTDTPNYPQVLIGTKPWGSDTGSSLFPIQRGEIDQFELVLDIEQQISGNQWNLAEEWWLTSKQPDGDVSDSRTHEVMLVLDWGSGHTHGDVIEADAITDSYGNTIDHWANYPSGIDFHIFRIAAQEVPRAVDLTAIMEYMSANVDSVSSELWLSGVELGNENWDNTAGTTSIKQFDVTVNGQTATSGSAGKTDTTPPAAPTNLSSPSRTAATVTLDWDGATDAGGSGVAEYTVAVDGTVVERLDAETTSATVDGLAADTSYEFAVTAIDGAGNTSKPATVTERTRSEQRPYNGPHTLPGRIQAEDFDVGGEGVAYHDTSEKNEGGAYRETSVDISSAPGDDDSIGWIAPGEWWEYTVTVEADSSYDIAARVASPRDGGAFHIAVDGSPVAETNFDETGGWNAWETIAVGSVDLTAGEHVIRVTADASYWNCNWFEFTPATDPLLVTDYSSYPGGNELGKWSSAADFQNGDGEVVDGALELDYDNAGWYVEGIDRDISDYSHLGFRIRGANGGEETDFMLTLGGARNLFADMADSAITTEFSDVQVDLAAAGVNRSSPGQLRLEFWPGDSGRIQLDKIWLA